MTAFVLAASVAGAGLGAVLGLLGSALLGGVSPSARLVLLAIAFVVALAVDLRPGPAPGPHRQVDERWLDRYRGWVYGVGYGAQLGFGLATVVSSAATYVALLAALSERRRRFRRAGPRGLRGGARADPTAGRRRAAPGPADDLARPLSRRPAAVRPCRADRAAGPDRDRGRGGPCVNLSAHGISVALPQGWSGRVFRRDGGNATLHAASFPLPLDDGEFGDASTARMAPGAAFLALTEYVPGAGLQPGHGLFSAERITLPLEPTRFSIRGLAHPRPGQSGHQQFFTASGRPFSLYVVIAGDRAHRRRQLPLLNRILGGAQIAPR